MADLTQSNAGPARLRELLAGEQLVVAPGAYDALSARLVEQAGFDVVYMTGYGATASLLGRPDVGLLSMSEMADQARRLVQAVAVPVIADADNGYGGPLNVVRTVREYAAAGIAALHVEDQVIPKKCGHMENKRVVAPGEMVEKVHAMVEGRGDHDIVLIARTDARAPEGLDSALERVGAYRDAGADVIFIDALLDEDEAVTFGEAFPDVPKVINYVEGGKTPFPDVERLGALGFRLMFSSVTTLLAATGAIQQRLAALRDATHEQPEPALAFDEFNEVVGLSDVAALEARVAG
ncbi:MAG: 2,3-dimethylmalate lyase [Solirubrobacteraceae bacterium]|jgi:2-methylisocitrate lyase-like PEP mutase family enzyme|nr:2,3-dimethylmalate lyase [Solirubrobacteraceae bacterium]